MIQYKIVPNDTPLIFWDLEHLPIAFELEYDIFHDGGLIKWKDVFYTPIIASHINTQNVVMIGIREYKNGIGHTVILTDKTEDRAEDLDESEITCPYCKYEESDSWEKEPEEENFECANCGGSFAYERETLVTYSMKPIKAPTIYEPKGNE